MICKKAEGYIFYYLNIEHHLESEVVIHFLD